MIRGMVRSFLLSATVLLSCATVDRKTLHGTVSTVEGPFEWNECSPNHRDTVSKVLMILRDNGIKEGFVQYWPPKNKIDICIVDDKPYVACQGADRILAGCTEPGYSNVSTRVFVSTRWAPDGENVQSNYDWRQTLAHELIMALAMDGVLVPPAPQGGSGRNFADLPKWEMEFIQSDLYKKYLASVGKILNETSSNTNNMCVVA